MALVDSNTLEEWEKHGNSDEFLNLLVEITTSENDDWKREQVTKIDQWSRSHKSKFHPEKKNQDLSNLKNGLLALMDKEDSEENKNKKKEIIKKIASARASMEVEFKRYNKVTQKIERKISTIVSSLKGSGGKSNRARKAGMLSKHAGKSKIDGVEKDKHGNAKGTEFDLGVDGAFDAFEIVVLQIYHFTKEYVVQAFTKKGFLYQWHEHLPSPESLERILESPSVSQLWIISSCGESKLTKEHCEVIEKFFHSGRSLYIWGDNEPYFSEANVLTNHLFGSEMNLFGNEEGCKVVHCHTESGGKNYGILEHLVSTGLEHLYEGATVSSLDDRLIRKHGFEPLLYGSVGNLITAVRGARQGCGAVIVDGAFTRLFCNVDDAGTIRFIINAACWLAVESARPVSVEDLKDGEESETNEISFSAEKALSGAVCSISFEEVPIGFLSFMKLGDDDANTTDWVLNDPLGYGEMNHRIIGRNIYGEQTGKFILEIGQDPYLRTPVAGLLPAVDLGIPHNFQLFSDELCRIFMASKKLYSQAQLLFVGTLDYLMGSDVYSNFEDDTKKVVEFMFEQGITHFKSTPDFTDIGDKVPLIEAMKQYFTVSPPLEQISKSFSTVCLIARTLSDRKLVEIDELIKIVRRSFFKFIVSASIKFIKEKKENSEIFHSELERLFFECWHCIPRFNSGRIISKMPSFIPNYYETPLKRFEAATGQTVLNWTEVTFLLYQLNEIKDLSMFRVEALLENLTKNQNFLRVWNNSAPLDNAFVLSVLNSKFVNYKGVPGGKHTLSNCFVPFATVFGPTVFRCAGCDAVFGDPNKEPTNEYCEAVKKARNQHFKEVFQSDASGYPSTVSHHFSLHRTIQSVMTTQFPGQFELKDEMIVAVSKQLASGKGNIFRENIEEMVVRGIESFLAIRKINTAAEFVSGRVSFNQRLILERSQLLANK